MSEYFEQADQALFELKYNATHFDSAMPPEGFDAAMSTILPLRIYTPGEIAKMFKVNPTTVTVWLREKTLIGFKINKRDWRITQDELKKFINGRHGE